MKLIFAKAAVGSISTDASATVPRVAVMVQELRTPGATSAANPPLDAVIVPLLTIEASGRSPEGSCLPFLRVGFPPDNATLTTGR